ncbi:MAG: hemerythrin domain-containing protein [Planctomycetales bacterium]|nr:hemerythrin domain-containing protein [Planctomycetales bacterium]
MIIATRTVAVNAAFLQEIKQDSVELQHLLQETADQLLHPRSRVKDVRSLADLLAQLRDQLAMHFALEEAFGYFEDALEVAPRLSRRAEELRSEHDLFFRDICSLCDHVDSLPGEENWRMAMRGVAARFSAFFDAFHQHETRERELIMEAFDDDIGCGD